MKRPDYFLSNDGFCLPVRYVSHRDGDTAIYRVFGGSWLIQYINDDDDCTCRVEFPGGLFTWAVRLLDCWTPEKWQVGGKHARAYFGKLMEKHGNAEASLWCPKPPQLENLLKLVTFDRVLGYVFLDEYLTINELMVVSGWAGRTKDELIDMQDAGHFEWMVEQHPELES